MPRTTLNKLLDTVGLPRTASGKLFHEYSTGMRQRLQLERAILPPASLILLDEPTNGLDQDGLAMLDALIADHSDASVVFVSHDPGFVNRHAHQHLRLGSIPHDAEAS